MASSITEVNKDFYNKAYSNRFSIFVLLHSFISYDQQSKSKRNYKVISNLIEEIRKVKTKITFLDYGFGHGSLILKIPSDIEIFGCDIAEEAGHKFNRISELLKRKITVSTVEDLDSVSHGIKFDTITCSHVIEHVENDIVFLKELKALLNKNGTLIINLPINEVWDDPKHARKYTKESVIELVSKMGLVIKKVIEADKLTGFLLYYEQKHSFRKLFKLLFRCLRLLFAIFPQSISEVIEKMLPSKFLNQQLIVVASKDE